MATLTVLSGLPGAGKTTRARELGCAGAFVVGRDELRAMLVAPLDEASITRLAAVNVRALLECGCDVVVDGWNLEPWDAELWRGLAADTGAELVWLHLETPVQVCVLRDAERPLSIGAEAVQAAAARYADRLAALAA